MSDILRRLTVAGSLLANATHVVFTAGGDDLDLTQMFIEIIFVNNFASGANKVMSLKPSLVSAYKSIKDAVRPGTKIFALPYVNFVSVGDKIPNEDNCRRLMDMFSDTIKAAAEEANIEFIESIK